MLGILTPMIVCHCEAVNDRTITDTILSGATSPDEVADRCGAGGQCGGCLDRVEALLDAVDASLPATAVA